MISLSSKAAAVVCLLSFSAPLFAFSIQCQQVPQTATKQCMAVGKNASKLYGLTSMPYALCSKALCMLEKRYPHKARCTCPLYKGKGWSALSISPSNYAKAKPTWGKNHQLRTVQSNYSLANIASNPKQKEITCQFEKPKPWADCFGVRCTVNATHTATCLCPISTSKVFVITGPGTTKKCVTKTNQAWSAISLNDAQTNNGFVQALYSKLYPGR